MQTIIWWIRRDLRLADNPALVKAIWAARESSARLLPLFILDPALLRRPAPARQAFLFSGLRQLDADLSRYGSRLVVRAGLPGEVFALLSNETPTAGIFAAEDFSPYAERRDGEIARVAPLHLTQGTTVFHPAAVLKPDGKPYSVFTPFSRAWKDRSLPGPGAILSVPEVFPACPDLPDEPFPDLLPPAGFPAGEKEAEQRLRVFCRGALANYADQRNRLDLPGTSLLSPYLRFGMLSPRQALVAALQVLHEESLGSSEPGSERQKGAEAWINELIWREFYTAILYHFPDVLRGAFNPALKNIPWRYAPQDLQAWQAGLTGYPVVDAGMRQLAETGWMHNRARMLVASFLVKDLLIDWQEGEDWFMQHLVDGDPAANNGGWQWTAGVGTNAAPYFRIFNPILQGMKFDPMGNYVRQWLPELAKLPVKWIHRPWEMPLDLCRTLGFQVGRDYPLPLVEHTLVRDRTLAAYRRPLSAKKEKNAS